MNKNLLCATADFFCCHLWMTLLETYGQTWRSLHVHIGQTLRPSRRNLPVCFTCPHRAPLSLIAVICRGDPIGSLENAHNKLRSCSWSVIMFKPINPLVSFIFIHLGSKWHIAQRWEIVWSIHTRHHAENHPCAPIYNSQWVTTWGNCFWLTLVHDTVFILALKSITIHSFIRSILLSTHNSLSSSSTLGPATCTCVTILVIFFVPLVPVVVYLLASTLEISLSILDDHTELLERHHCQLSPTFHISVAGTSSTSSDVATMPWNFLSYNTSSNIAWVYWNVLHTCNACTCKLHAI